MSLQREMEIVTKALVVFVAAGLLCLFAPVGDLVLFLLDKIGLHVGGIALNRALRVSRRTVSVNVVH